MLSWLRIHFNSVDVNQTRPTWICAKNTTVSELGDNYFTIGPKRNLVFIRSERRDFREVSRPRQTHYLTNLCLCLIGAFASTCPMFRQYAHGFKVPLEHLLKFSNAYYISKSSKCQQQKTRPFFWTGQPLKESGRTPSRL